MARVDSIGADNVAANYTLITGASSGIGKALAEEAAKDGRDLILVARTTKALEEVRGSLAKKYGVRVEYVAQDLSAPGAAEAVYRALADRGLTIDTLINNAGLGEYGAFVESDMNRARAMIMVNVLALTELTRLFLPDLLKQRRARIMNVASVVAFLPGPFMSVYYATKHYVLAFSEGLMEELRDRKNLTITALCPPPMATHFMEAAGTPRTNHMVRTAVTPEGVARFGYRAMEAGKSIAVHGSYYRFLTSFIVRVTPRARVRKILYKLNNQGRANAPLQ